MYIYIKVYISMYLLACKCGTSHLTVLRRDTGYVALTFHAPTMFLYVEAQGTYYLRSTCTHKPDRTRTTLLQATIDGRSTATR